MGIVLSYDKARDENRGLFTQVSFVASVLIRLWLAGSMALKPYDAAAVTAVRLEGVLGGKAVLSVDGQRRVLAVGETSPEGIKLLQVGRDSARVEINGQRRELPLGGVAGGHYGAVPGAELRIPAGSHGHYEVTGLINGQPVTMLVDLGASLVSMTASTARRLHIPYLIKGEKTWAMTAKGPVTVYRVTLDSVQVGPIQLRGVAGDVREVEGDDVVLLGMSFLGQLQLEQQQKVLVLRQR